jgi:hypothetical protein
MATPCHTPMSVKDISGHVAEMCVPPEGGQKRETFFAMNGFSVISTELILNELVCEVTLYMEGAYIVKYM